MSNKPTHIIKFGGTSLQNEPFIKQAATFVEDRLQNARPVVVVSAVAGVTDALITLADQSTADCERLVSSLKEKHVKLFDRLAKTGDHRRESLVCLFDELTHITGRQPDKLTDQRARKDHILSIGERASALILAATLSKKGYPATAFEASNFIKTDATFGEARVQPDATRKLIRRFLQQSDTIPVITGFIGSDSQDRITTLGRSGSDYTAGLLADALEADHMEIWTDVNGVLSADPRWVPSAEPIAELSFADIGELAAHGARVIHPKTISPISAKDISVRVKNSAEPEHPGTLISRELPSNGSFKTITISGPFVRLEVKDAFGVDLFEQLHSWLADETDSEAWSFSRNSAFEPTRLLIRQELFETIQTSLDNWVSNVGPKLSLEKDIYKVKKFSNDFKQSEQLTSRILSIFSAHGLQPLQINRNNGERFISFLFKKNEAQDAAQLMNDFIQPDKTVINLFVAGTGAVGQTLLRQLEDVKMDNLEIQILGHCNSKKTTWNVNKPADPLTEQTNWQAIIERLSGSHNHNLIFVDATGSEQVARLYPELFKAGIHVVTPSKRANTFEQSYFDELQATAAKNDASFKYETTVGAGLPVISTLKSLQQSGDEIHKISGVVSGTMTYLFNQLEKGVPFSTAVADARERGYAEPDPRDDLSGGDVARKFLTIARTLGHKVEPHELQVESLIPDELQNVNYSTFLEELKSYDDQWKKKLQAAARERKVLRYTGQLKEGKIIIGIEAVSKHSPLGRLQETNNLIQIYSRHYHSQPLVIQGPGAGKEVTAAGVLADIMKVADKID